MPKTIVWLASYPKSGNTWLRLFLFNYLFNLDRPAPINQTHRVGPSDASALLYRTAAVGPADLRDEKTVLRLRRRVIETHASNGADVNFMKTHNANIKVQGVSLIPADMTRCALYVLRNPIDVALSYAHHYGLSHDGAATALGNPLTGTLADDSVVQQYLGNWSAHVRGWARARDLKTCVLRYEDMQRDPQGCFGRALRHIGAPVDDARLDRAIRFSSFDEAKKQEQEFGFVEKGQQSGTAFFRSGKVGEGREAMPQSAIDRLIGDHGETMKHHGYLE